MYTKNKPLVQNLKEKNILVAAHRGTSGGNIIWNTTLSYKNALLHGADMIEIDAAMTKDGVFYAFHNTEEIVEFGKDCDIREMTSDEVEKINLHNAIQNLSGQTLERLENVLPKFKGKCLINIDRSWFYWKEIIQFLKNMEMDDQILLKCGVNREYLQQLQDSQSGLMYMPIVNSMEEWNIVQEYDINVCAAELIFDSLDHELVRPDFLAMLNEKGILPWVNSITLNDTANLSGGLDDNHAISDGFDQNWGKLIDMGFKIIQTDWPALLSRYVKEKF